MKKSRTEIEIRATSDVHHHGGPPEVHLRDYWKIIWQGRHTVLGILILNVGLSVLRVLLETPIYQATAAYGHFGRTDIDAPWESTDRAQSLRDAAGL